jgi:hypothetical protein
MRDNCKYLYGIIEAEKGLDFGNIGINGEKVYTICYGDIGAVMSDYPMCKIQPLRENLKLHHEVIKEVNKRCTIIPMTFGHIAKGTDDILQVLKNNFSVILHELKKLDNKLEMGLKMFWDVDNVFEYFLKMDRELENYRDRLFGKASLTTYEEKLELGMLFTQKLNEEREQHADIVINVFKDCIVDVRMNKPTDEKMILNAAFLIDSDKVKEYDVRARRVANLFDGHFMFDYNGPWAPYNFTELRLKA